MFVALLLIGTRGSRAQEFRIGEWRAYALLGAASLREEVHYVAFSGHHGLQQDWLPNEKDLIDYVRRDASLLSRFQLRVVNLGLPLPEYAGNPLGKRIEEIVLDSLTTAGYDVASRANSHALDFGTRGVRYYDEKLESAGLRLIGERRSPVFHWQAGNRRIDICAVAGVLDRPDPEHLILMADEAGLALLRRETEGADFRIAFANFGSASRYPSPRERRKVRELLSAGFGLVVCTGSHFIKGFLLEEGRPVAYGIGDHLYSIQYGLIDTEPLGMHLVAGFEDGQLVQIFVVPFHNDVRRGRLGPLDEATFREFLTALRERSTSDEAKYFSDKGAFNVMIHALENPSATNLRKLRPRHFAYAARLVLQQRPEWVAGVAVVLGVAAVVVLRRRSSRKRREMQGNG